MKSGWGLKLAVAVIVLSLVAWGVLKCNFDGASSVVQDRHRQAVRRKRARWQNEIREQEERHREELSAALGGGTDAIVKNPNLTIPEMVRSIAVASAPDNCRVDVETDNFTEIDVYVTLRDKPDKNEVATMVKDVLSVCDQYVNAISFVYGGQTVKMIDRRAIDQIGAWRTADLETVADAMITP